MYAYEVSIRDGPTDEVLTFMKIFALLYSTNKNEMKMVISNY